MLQCLLFGIILLQCGVLTTCVGNSGLGNIKERGYLVDRDTDGG
jgi:hypothetical protein